MPPHPALAHTPAPAANRPAWKAALANAVSDVTELTRLLALPATDSEALARACEGFPLRVPRGFVDRMRKGDPTDPLLRQVLPDIAELVQSADYSLDPLDEATATALPGLLHKYESRALITLTSSCAVHCRYCFRRHFEYSEHRIGTEQWQAIIRYIEQDRSINEIILSGGDPLNMPDSALAPRVRDLAKIEHVKRLRIHTRQPVVLPERIDANLIDWLGETPLDTVVVIHTNHANELDASVAKALGALRATGATLLNQSVLLAGVNDNAEALIALSERLFDCGVLPYYLHMPDAVQGTAHFDVSDTVAHSLIASMQARLPGYLVPKLAREVPGETSKRVLQG